MIFRRALYALLILFSALPAFAETLELVTYYPTAANTGDQHTTGLTVGPGYLNVDPADGVALIETRLGIGTNDPQEQLQITGNLRLPPTTATTGIIMSGANPFIHNFGANNFFAGVDAGNLKMTGVGGNTGVGREALKLSATGIFNTAVGFHAGVTNTLANADTAGVRNTYIGMNAGPGTLDPLINATALGANALVSADNALVLGGTGTDAVSVGIGTPTPQATLDVTSDGGAILVPRKTTAGDPAVVTGMIYYNANAKRFRTYQDGGWQSLDGGWRLVYRDDFESGANGWSPGNGTTIAGTLILGGYNVAGKGVTLSKYFDLTGIPHTQIKVELDYYAIDSWDGEWAYVWAAGNTIVTTARRVIWAQRINQTDPGRANFGGSPATDGIYHAVLTGPHSDNSLGVTAGSTLDQGLTDESYGIDNVEVWVR